MRYCGGGSRLDTLVILALAVGLPLIWIAGLPRAGASWNPVETTSERLIAAEHLVEVFIKELGEVPPSLAELKVFARATGRSINLHDGWGARFDYLRLDSRHFVLRSFGRDGLQNTLVSAPDEGVFRSGTLPTTSLVAKWRTRFEPQGYPAAMLLGADSPNHVWHARLFVDPLAGTRRLLVRRRDTTNLHMFAPHDSVEEFLWLPGGHQLVFTATGSARWRDGIWLWNLLNDSIVNLLDANAASNDQQAGARPSGQPGTPTSATPNQWFLSLLGVTVAPQVVYAAVVPRGVDAPLDPAVLYSAAAIRAWVIADPTDDETVRPVPVDLPQSVTTTDILARISKSASGGDDDPGNPKDLREDGESADTVAGTRTQKTWAALPRSGNKEQVLGAWSDFAEKNAASPLFPYALWQLTGFYAEASRISQEQALSSADGKNPSEALRTFGAEIAKAASALPMAPLYVRAMAGHQYGQLLRGEIPAWSVGRFDSNTAAKGESP